MSRPLPASISDSSDLRESLSRRTRGGALWFFAVGALSLLQCATYYLGFDLGFVFGLGSSEVFHAISRAAAFDDGPGMFSVLLFSVVADAFVASFLLHAGSLARSGSGWAYVIGIAFYAVDALLLLAAGLTSPALFHACALAGLLIGAEALRRLRRLDESESGLASAAA
jgi:hypothetical protein